jgi:hypothetical protein
MYISQDPIRLNGGIRIYNYAYDTNSLVDVFGLIGSYSSLKRQNRGNSNIEIHHIPPRAALEANGLPQYGTPAIAMSIDDHAQTASYGSRGQQYIDTQTASLATHGGSYYDAMSRDIADVRNISHEYDKGIIDAIDYAETKGMVNSEEANKLRLQSST